MTVDPDIVITSIELTWNEVSMIQEAFGNMGQEALSSYVASDIAAMDSASEKMNKAWNDFSKYDGLRKKIREVF